MRIALRELTTCRLDADGDSERQSTIAPNGCRPIDSRGQDPLAAHETKPPVIGPAVTAPELNRAEGDMYAISRSTSRYWSLSSRKLRTDDWDRTHPPTRGKSAAHIEADAGVKGPNARTRLGIGVPCSCQACPVADRARSPLLKHFRPGGVNELRGQAALTTVVTGSVMIRSSCIG